MNSCKHGLTAKMVVIEGEDPKQFEIVRERLQSLNLPTIIGYPFGHNDEPNSIWLGREVVFDANAKTISLATVAQS